MPISASVPYVATAPSAPSKATDQLGTNGATASAMSTDASAMKTTRPTSHRECWRLGLRW
jgi:hypothetical protein